MGVVTNRQIFFIVLFSITASAFMGMPGNAIKAAGTGAWLAILIVAIVFAFGIFIIASLNQMFEGKIIHEYAELLVGKVMTKIIGIIYIIHFSFFSILLFRGSAEFIKEIFLPTTPKWVILALFMAVAQYMVYKGITTIGRLLEFYGFIFLVVPLTVHTVMFFVGDLNYIKPFFEPELVKEYIFGTKDLIYAFVGIEILTIIPFGKINLKSGVWYAMISVLYVGLYYVINTETSVMILGINQVLLHKASLVEALRQVNLPYAFFLKRFDTAFLTVGIMAILSGMASVLFATVENTLKLFAMNQRNIVLVVVGMILFILCLFLNKPEVVTYLSKNILPISGILTGYIIPIILFVLAKAKKYGN